MHMMSTPNEMKDMVMDRVEKAQTAVKTRVETVQARVKERVADAQQKVQEFEKKAQEVVHNVSGRLYNVGERVKSETTEAGKKVTEVVEQLPGHDAVKQWFASFPVDEWVKVPSNVREEMYERLGLVKKADVDVVVAKLEAVVTRLEAMEKNAGEMKVVEDLVGDVKKLKTAVDKLKAKAADTH